MATTRRKLARTARGAGPIEDPECARAWDRLEQAEARLLRVGGDGMERAVDGFYDAWMERMAVILEGAGGGADAEATLAELEARVAALEAAATTPECHEAMTAFVQIAILEVEAAVVRSAGPPPSGRGPRAQWDEGEARWGRC